MKLLSAFIEFAARGADSVKARAKEIEQTIRSIPGVANVELKAGGASQFVQTIAGATAKLDAMKAKAEVKFSATGVGSVESAANSVREKLATIASSPDLAQALGVGVEDAFRTAGEGAGAAFFAGIGGMAGGAAGALFGNQIASILSAVPNLIGHQVELARDAAKIEQHSLTKEEAASWRGATAAGRVFWSRFNIGDKGGAELFQEGIEKMQMNGPAPKVPTTPEEREKFNAEMRAKAAEAEAIMNASLALAVSGRVGDPVAFAEKVDKLQLTHRPREKAALANEDFVFTRLQEKYTRNSPEEIQAAIRMKDTQRGAITTDEIVSAALGDVTNPRTQSYLRAKTEEWSRAHGIEMGGQLWQGQNQLQPDELEYVRRRRAGQSPEDATAPRSNSGYALMGGPGGGAPAQFNQSIKIAPEQQARLERLLSAESGNVSSLLGMTPPSVPAHELGGLAGAGAGYQFTSITGLAEKMQMEASRGRDPGEKTADNTQRIADGVEELNAHFRRGSSAPAGAMPQSHFLAPHHEE